MPLAKEDESCMVFCSRRLHEAIALEQYAAGSEHVSATYAPGLLAAHRPGFHHGKQSVFLAYAKRMACARTQIQQSGAVKARHHVRQTLARLLLSARSSLSEFVCDLAMRYAQPPHLWQHTSPHHAWTTRVCAALRRMSACARNHAR